MGGNYGKGLYDQLMDVMEKLDVLEADLKKARHEIRRLTAETESLRSENRHLNEELGRVKEENTLLEKKCARLEQENDLLRDDNERMKRILGNDSSNSSVPPSAEPPWKAPNTYNGRKAGRKRQGAQPGHKGSGLSKSDVCEKIRNGDFHHKVEDIGSVGNTYVTRYRIDLETRVVATEYRIHAGTDGKYEIPEDLLGDVTYGDRLKAVCAYLYAEGVVSIDRICDFINSLSDGALSLSAGSVYNFCAGFAGKCAGFRTELVNRLLNAHEICTDATPVTNNGKMNYIRNFSTEDTVLYCGMAKKDLQTLEALPVLGDFAGILCHDHETSMYHFGIGHAECNVHLARYLRKNTEETGNRWSHEMESFLNGMNAMRNRLKAGGAAGLPEGKAESYSQRFDAIIADGREQQKTTRGKVARQEENALLNRLEKYKENHLLFLYDFQVHYSDNMSEKDLRICKNREKMAGGFRTDKGIQIYCNIMSFIETVKRKKGNVLQSISSLMNGTLVRI